MLGRRRNPTPFCVSDRVDTVQQVPVNLAHRAPIPATWNTLQSRFLSDACIRATETLAKERGVDVDGKTLAAHAQILAAENSSLVDTDENLARLVTAVVDHFHGASRAATSLHRSSRSMHGHAGRAFATTVARPAASSQRRLLGSNVNRETSMRHRCSGSGSLATVLH